jgi:hypothetical protein
MNAYYARVVLQAVLVIGGTMRKLLYLSKDEMQYAITRNPALSFTA